MSGTRGVSITINHVKQLYKLDLDKSLEENISELCYSIKRTAAESYGLKLVEAPNKKYYITEETFKSLVNGCFLELCPALNVILRSIFDNIDNELKKVECYQQLYELASDASFIDILISQKKHGDICNLLMMDGITEIENAQIACLLILLQLLKKTYISIPPNVLEQLTAMIKPQNNETQYALAVLCQILFSKHEEMKEHKMFVIKNVPVSELIKILTYKESLEPELIINALRLIIAIINQPKNEKRKSIIKELLNKENRMVIYNIITSIHISDTIAQELYLLQTYLLSIYAEAATNGIILNEIDLDIINKEIDKDHDTISMGLIDFVDSKRKSLVSNKTNLYTDTISRFSILSSSTQRSSNSSRNSDMEISHLSYNCLVYYREKHFKNFCQSQTEENTYEPGIVQSTHRVMQIITDLLNITTKRIKSGKKYLPLFFNPEINHTYFMEELFSRVMWLLSKTRKEMRARSEEDYEKLLNVLKEELEIIFDMKPHTFKGLLTRMKETSYNTVVHKWEVERQRKWVIALQKNQCIKNLMETYSEQNEMHLFDDRMLILQSGQTFPKLPEKKYKGQYIHIKLSPNRKKFSFGDWNLDAMEYNTETRCDVNAIRHFIAGQACPPIKDKTVSHSKIDLIFTIMLADEVNINCLAPNNTIASHWIDGFCLLLGMPQRSKLYRKELMVFAEMDCALHLIELQNIEIPLEPPPVPEAPITLKPSLPPKISRSMSRNSQY